MLAKPGYARVREAWSICASARLISSPSCLRHNTPPAC